MTIFEVTYVYGGTERLLSRASTRSEAISRAMVGAEEGSALSDYLQELRKRPLLETLGWWNGPMVTVAHRDNASD